jgi:hypothetical protein
MKTMHRAVKQTPARLVRTLVLGLLSASLLWACAAAEPQANLKASAQKSVASGANYGKPMPLDPPAQAVASVSANFASLAGSDIKLSGRVSKVCQKKGCWMMLSDGDQALRVIFGSHDFFIPKDTIGNAVAYGRLEKIEMPLADAKHMAEDAGLDPDTVTKPEVEYRLVATSVQIEQG